MSAFAATAALHRAARPSPSLAAIRAAAAGASNTVHLKINPRPRNLAESRQIVQVLRQYGPVEYYKHAKYEAHVPLGYNTAIAVFKSATAANNLMQASPISFTLTPVASPDGTEGDLEIMMAQRLSEDLFPEDGAIEPSHTTKTMSSNCTETQSQDAEARPDADGESEQQPLTSVESGWKILQDRHKHQPHAAPAPAPALSRIISCSSSSSRATSHIPSDLNHDSPLSRARTASLASTTPRYTVESITPAPKSPPTSKYTPSSLPSANADADADAEPLSDPNTLTFTLTARPSLRDPMTTIETSTYHGSFPIVPSSPKSSQEEDLALHVPAGLRALARIEADRFPWERVMEWRRGQVEGRPRVRDMRVERGGDRHGPAVRMDMQWEAGKGRAAAKESEWERIEGRERRREMGREREREAERRRERERAARRSEQQQEVREEQRAAG